MTAASWLNRRNSSPAAGYSTRLMNTVTAAVMPRQMRVPLRTRSYWRAPKFCPAKVVMAMPNELTVIQNRKSILP